MYRGNGKRVWYRSAAPCRGTRTSVGWVGSRAKVTNPTQTSLRSSSIEGSHLTCAPTHPRISHSRSTPPTGLGGFARRRAALTPAPALGHQPAWLWVGPMPRLRARACAARPSSVREVRDPTGAPSPPRELRRPQAQPPRPRRGAVPPPPPAEPCPDRTRTARRRFRTSNGIARRTTHRPSNATNLKCGGVSDGLSMRGGASALAL